jgi:hypothetical protein
MMIAGNKRKAPFTQAIAQPINTGEAAAGSVRGRIASHQR